MTNLADVLRAQGKLAKAEQMYREASCVSRATFGSNHPDTLDCLHKLAESLWPQKNCVEVEELFCEAIHR